MLSLRRALALVACLAVLAFQAGPAFAADTPATPATIDPSLKAMLEKLEMKYEIGPDGDVKLTFGLDDGRSQLVFIQGTMEEYAGMKIREIWAPAAKVKGALPQDVANKLLVDSQDRKIGGWQVMQLGEESLVVYAIKVPDVTDADVLFKLLNAVMMSADQMENEITGKDDY